MLHDPEVIFLAPELRALRWPDHTQLPDSDGKFAESFLEHPQMMLLTNPLWPVLNEIHPDGQFCIGQDSGIYWNLAAVQTDNPVLGAVSPDWFYIPNVPPLLDGHFRRSYVLWHERVSPFVIIELVFDDREPYNQTPGKGKFWIYEKVICPKYYAIYEVKLERVEVYQLEKGRFIKMQPNEHGNYPINPLGVELGVWHGAYQNMILPWLRWWDNQGNLLPTGHERAEVSDARAEAEAERANAEAERANAEAERAKAAAERAERLAAKLRELGIEAED